ncbi:OmpA family protein [Pluralibacter gergoviae]|uniref:OmpA family protein n=1 Tax=Pluralibacter gergoviae TaxID=61647 RepID=UPI003EE013D1
MRRSVIASVIVHALAATAGVLWLLWYFIPLGNLIKTGVTLLLAVLVILAVLREKKRGTAAQSVADALPEIDTSGPVMLVCGEDTGNLFSAQPLRKTSQGWWLQVGEVSRLAGMVKGIQQRQPHAVGQLAVMFICCPDRYQDEPVMRAPVKALREQIVKLQAVTGFQLPVVVSCEVSGPDSPWIIIRGDKPVVCPAGGSPVAFADWQNTHLFSLPVISQAFTLMRTVFIDELVKPDRLYPAVNPFAAVLKTGAPAGETTSVWSNWLNRRSGLLFSPSNRDGGAEFTFPDALLPLLRPVTVPVQGGALTRRLVAVLLACALATLGFSAGNNQALIRKVGADLARWYAIPMDHYVPKARSLAVLKQDALLLERWQRQGEPVRYGLGYYPGQRLWLAVQQAIDTWIPAPVQPSAPEQGSPQTVRLNSMALFDTGQSSLKPGATKLLVSALVGIKARPGWLIVVSGHTDSTGSPPVNQALSLRRAEAVRDWMRDTGDVPGSCFAVQGYGAGRPAATNDTPEGRAQNRRVEISLVPQADACRAPGEPPAPSKDDGASHLRGE